MKTEKFGLVIFWLGAAYMFVASWLVMWWVAPIWQNSPPEEFIGTIWEFGGPVFTIIALSVPVGVLLTAIGMLLYSESARPQLWPFAVFVIGGVVVALSMLFPPTLGYYPVLFGISGGLILVLFFAVLYYWANNRKTLSGSAKIAADLQLVSYVFFLLAASLMCSLLGNPFSGLYFPEKVLQYEALPFHYSMGTKAVIYFVFGWVFNFLSQYVIRKSGRHTENIPGT